MNWKRFIIAVVVGYIAIQIMDFIIHWGILGETYKALAGTVFRAEGEMPMWPMYLGGILFTLMFVWIYTYGVKVRASWKDSDTASISGCFIV